MMKTTKKRTMKTKKINQREPTGSFFLCHISTKEGNVLNLLSTRLYMQDNFELIREMLDFSETNTFYFVQILKRRKENPEMPTGARVVNCYYLYSAEDLDKVKPKIVEDCTKYNARAYINLNRLDLQKVAMHTLKQIVDYVMVGDFRAVKNAYATACGSHHSEKQKRWVIDIDEDFLDRKEEVRQIVEKLHAEIGNSYRILAEVPTRSGVHLISNPFNMEKFRKIIAERASSEKDSLLKVDVQKNSPTILYIS